MKQHATRRQVVAGIAGLSLASLLADSKRVSAAAASLQEVTTEVKGKMVKAAFALPEGASKEKPVGAVILIHEWWGLNNQIKAVASEVASLGYTALALDLYDGKVATNPDDAKKYMNAVDPSMASATMSAWATWLRNRPESSQKVAVIGWCFGGGMALQASLDSKMDGTVIYYGNVARSKNELGALQGPVLGHFATQDQWINQEMVKNFETEMQKAGKKLEAYTYDADHAFANPTGNNYDAEDARLAWDRTIEFLKRVLG